MRTRDLLTGAFLAVALLGAGCSQKSSPPQSTPAAAPTARQDLAAVPAPTPAPGDVAGEAASALAPQAAPEAEASAPSAAPEMPAAKAAPAPAAVPSPTPVPASAPPAQAAATTPKPEVAPAPAPAATAAIVDPGGVVAVGATKPGLTPVGSDECGNCHDVQYTSWSEGPHAARKPPLDCEGCHGPGSEYSPKSVMKDPDKARAAGLVMPDKAFCGKCHKQGVNDDLMKKAHAHD